jgi:hypothetical protein
MSRAGGFAKGLERLPKGDNRIPSSIAAVADYRNSPRLPAKFVQEMFKSSSLQPFLSHDKSPNQSNFKLLENTNFGIPCERGRW